MWLWKWEPWWSLPKQAHETRWKALWAHDIYSISCCCLCDVDVIEASLAYVSIFPAFFGIVSVMNLLKFKVWAMSTRYSGWTLCRGPSLLEKGEWTEDLVLALGQGWELYPESVWPGASWIWQARARKKHGWVRRSQLAMESWKTESLRVGSVHPATVSKETLTVLQRTLKTLNIHLLYRPALLSFFPHQAIRWWFSFYWHWNNIWYFLKCYRCLLAGTKGR